MTNCGRKPSTDSDKAIRIVEVFNTGWCVNGIWFQHAPSPEEVEAAYTQRFYVAEVRSVSVDTLRHWAQLAADNPQDLPARIEKCICAAPDPATPPIALPAAELDITTYNTNKYAGGFAPVNQNGVRILHMPTGISCQCGTERSYHANKLVALGRLTVAVNAVLAARASEAWEGF